MLVIGGIEPTLCIIVANGSLLIEFNNNYYLSQPGRADQRKQLIPINMEITKSLLEELVNIVNSQMNESYILVYNYIDLYSMYKIVDGFVVNGALGVRQSMDGNQMHYYLTGIIAANRANNVSQL